MSINFFINLDKSGHTDAIMLPGPAFGDEDIYEPKTRYKMSMAGDVRTYISKPVRRKFRLNYDKLTRSKLYEFFEFINNTAGAYLSFMHHNGGSYTGYLLATTLNTNTTSRFVGINVPYNQVISDTTVEFFVHTRVSRNENSNF